MSELDDYEKMKLELDIMRLEMKASGYPLWHWGSHYCDQACREGYALGIDYQKVAQSLKEKHKIENPHVYPIGAEVQD